MAIINYSNRGRVGVNREMTVTVNNDFMFSAIEARATKSGEVYGKGIGYDLLGDDVVTVNGEHELPQPATSFSFDVEASELDTEGDYRLSIYVKDEDGHWDDTVILFVRRVDAVYDSDGRRVLAKAVAGLPGTYATEYTGQQVDDFITAVLG